MSMIPKVENRLSDRIMLQPTFCMIPKSGTRLSDKTTFSKQPQRLDWKKEDATE